MKLLRPIIDRSRVAMGGADVLLCICMESELVLQILLLPSQLNIRGMGLVIVVGIMVYMLWLLGLTRVPQQRYG